MPNKSCGAREWMEKHGKKLSQKDAVAQCVKTTGCGITTARENYHAVVKAGNSVVVKNQQVISGGISLTNVNVFLRKPTDDCKRRFYALRRNTAYPITDLSKQCGVSVETLRKQAKAHDCLRYVELQPGEWVPCVLHPETAEKHKGGMA